MMPPALPPMPPRIAALPRDDRGRPIPWFVNDPVPGGKTDFRRAGQRQLFEAVRRKVCWVCGQPSGVYRCFVVGPLSALTRSSAEPPSHFDCALYAVQVCPFMVNPDMKRAAKEEDLVEVPGMFIERNPGVSVVWTTRDYRVARVGEGYLFDLGDAPTSLSWWRKGRPASREECIASIGLSLPDLAAAAEKEGERAAMDLVGAVNQLHRFLPPASVREGTILPAS